MTMNLAALTLLSWLAQSAAAPASPEVKAQAQQLLTEGTQKYQKGAYEDALESFSKAYAMFPSPKLFFNIGQAHRELGHPLDALRAFENFIQLATDASPELLAEAKQAAEKVAAMLGSLQIECPLAGTEIEIDGSLVGQTPLTDPVRATVGPHRITAIAPDRARDEKIVSVRAGGVTNVVMRLAANPRAGAGASNPIVQANCSSTESHGWWLGRKWTWVAAGSTVVFATGAIVAGLSMQSKFDSLRNRCGKGAGPDYQGCSSSDLDSLDTRRDLANVFWGLTAAAAATTGVLFYLEGRPVRVAPMAGSAMGMLVDARY
jgi:hypothetical protein